MRWSVCRFVPVNGEGPPHANIACDGPCDDRKRPVRYMRPAGFRPLGYVRPAGFPGVRYMRPAGFRYVSGRR